MTSVAIITGCDGQDGSYMSEYLIKIGFNVYGFIRKKSYQSQNLNEVIKSPKFNIVYLDSSEEIKIQFNILEIARKYPQSELYIFNFAAQTDVGYSFEHPNYTMKTNTEYLITIIQTVKNFNLKARIYQASTSEQFGDNCSYLDENTPFTPVSPYGISKVAAHQIAENSRHYDDIFVACGILFNHESPRRPSNFVTRKIIEGVKEFLKSDTPIVLGNIHSSRDWGATEDYIEAIYRIISNNRPDTFVVATGNSYTVKQFVEQVFKYHNKEISWSQNDEGYVDNKIAVKTDKMFFRQKDIHKLTGCPDKIYETLGWKPKVDNIEKLVEYMHNKN